eukprot:16165963-Heterocapsa_arctica.AAC.1
MSMCRPWQHRQSRVHQLCCPVYAVCTADAAADGIVPNLTLLLPLPLLPLPYTKTSISVSYTISTSIALSSCSGRPSVEHTLFRMR